MKSETYRVTWVCDIESTDFESAVEIAWFLQRFPATSTPLKVRRISTGRRKLVYLNLKTGVARCRIKRREKRIKRIAKTSRS